MFDAFNCYFGVVHRLRVIGAHSGASVLQDLNDRNRWRVSNIIRVGLESEPEDGDRPVLYAAAARLDHIAPMARLRSSLTCETVWAIRMRALKSCQLLTRADMSFGKQDPAVTGDRPAWRNFDPIRLPRPSPRATCCTSAPARSHKSAISLMNVIAKEGDDLYTASVREKHWPLGWAIADDKVST